MKNLVIIAGPTAAGKTALSIELCKKINGAVISADSIQVYKHMDIGSAKITSEEMSNVKHYGIDILDPRDDYNVAAFQSMAKKAIKDCYSQNITPVIVGGTGFYTQSVLYDINFENTDKDTTYRTELENLAKEKGQEYVHSLLKDKDYDSYISIHPNNLKRVIRALEYFKETGNPISRHNETQRQNQSPYNFAFFVITDNRDILYNRIDRRVDKMINDGLVNEVKYLQESGLNKSFVSMQGLGYKEIFDYLENKISLEEAVEIIKKETRHFAKRQITWFKREKEAIWINRSDYNNENEMLNFMLNELKKRDIYNE